MYLYCFNNERSIGTCIIKSERFGVSLSYDERVMYFAFGIIYFLFFFILYKSKLIHVTYLEG